MQGLLNWAGGPVSSILGFCVEARLLSRLSVGCGSGPELLGCCCPRGHPRCGRLSPSPGGRCRSLWGLLLLLPPCSRLWRRG